MQRLVMLGLNHTTAPLELRERVVFSQAQQRDAIAALRRRFGECEVVLLSTCNRVELYAARQVHGRPRVEELAQFLAEFHSVSPDDLKPHLYERAEREVVEHLFTVTSSLNSMVLGETQILGQVRTAYELAAELGAAGTALNPLFQRAIAVGKQVHAATTLSEGSVSVSGVAVQYARRIFDHFDDKTVLCVGAGKMAGLALKGFAALRPGRLIVCTRDPEKANRVAAEYGGTGAPFASIEQLLVQADVVITSTGAPRPVIHREMFERILRQRRYRPIFMIDIAVPRDVEPSIGELEHVYLYNMDDLQRVALEAQTQRSSAVDQAQTIVQQHVEEFLAWQRQRLMGPTIDRLYKRLHEMAGEEVQRTLTRLPHAGEQERAQLEELARRIVNKVLHDPVTAMKNADSPGQHGSPTQYLHAIEQMFRLNEGSDDAPADRNGPGE